MQISAESREEEAARLLCIEYPGAFYHVTARGSEQKDIFKSQRDREKFITYLEAATERYGAVMHAYCLMDKLWKKSDVETWPLELPVCPKDCTMPFTPKFLFPRERILELLQALSLAFWTFLWGFALTMSGLLIMGWLWGDRVLAVRLTNYLLPWLLMALLVALIPAVLFRRIWLILALAAPALAIGIGYLPVFLPHRAPPAENRALLEVMSFNVWSENPSMKLAAEMIRRENPDILLLQEISRERIRELTRALRGAVSGDGQVWHALHEPGLMQAVVSRHPLTPLMADRKKGKAQVVGVATPEGEVTVINVHPLRGDWLRRHRQMERLIEEDVLKATGPLILGGDFNTNDKSETYRMLTRHLRNAHWEAGRGFGFTYPAYRHAWEEIIPAWPLVRIDHIFYNGDFLALDARTFKESYGSDHFPVTARLVWKNSEQDKAAALPRANEKAEVRNVNGNDE